MWRCMVSLQSKVALVTLVTGARVAIPFGNSVVERGAQPRHGAAQGVDPQEVEVHGEPTV